MGTRNYYILTKYKVNSEKTKVFRKFTKEELEFCANYQSDYFPMFGEELDDMNLEENGTELHSSDVRKFYDERQFLEELSTKFPGVFWRLEAEGDEDHMSYGVNGKYECIYPTYEECHLDACEFPEHI